MSATLKFFLGSRTQRFIGFALAITIGQGSMLVLQTLLMMRGYSEVVGVLGLGLAILSFIQWIADWGGAILLARVSPVSKLNFTLADAVLARFVISLPLSLAFLMIVNWQFSANDFAFGMLLSGLAVFPVWACNITGYLDAQRAGASVGPLPGLPWLFASAATFIDIIIFGLDLSFLNGLIIGGSFAIGCAICVLVQHCYARSQSDSLGIASLSRHGYSNYIREGAYFCIGDIPAQFYNRALLVVVSANFAGEVLGAYVFSRQVNSALVQIISVVRRVEISAVIKVVTQNRFSLQTLIATQPISLSVAAVLVIAAGTWNGCLSLGVLCDTFSEKSLGLLAFVSIFVLSVPAWTLASLFGQVLLLRGHLKYYSLVASGATCVACITSLFAAPYFGVWSIVVVDLLLFAVQSYSFWRLADKRRILCP